MSRQWQAEDENDSGTPCACGRRCAESDYLGNAAPCPRVFCLTDEGYISRAITELPEQYVRLWLLLTPGERAGERVSGSREAPLPLAAGVQAFLREIVTVACSWEDHVRRSARLTPAPEARRRDSVALSAACRTLAAHMTTLLSLEPETKGRLISSRQLSEADPGALIYYDLAGDAFEYRELGGADAGLEFLAIAGRARGMLGLTRQRRRITEVPCDGCGCPGTLVQFEARDGGWEERVACTNCPNAYTGLAFGHFMGRVYSVQVAALEAEHRRRAVAA